jgi:hypothetical protein
MQKRDSNEIALKKTHGRKTKSPEGVIAGDKNLKEKDKEIPRQLPFSIHHTN